MRVYIAGPMTGFEAYNLHAFQRAQREWRLRGHDAIIPFESNSTVWQRHFGREFDPYTDSCDWGDPLLRELFVEDVAYLLSADAVAVLPGWQKSKGALLELHHALMFGLPIYDNLGKEVRDEEVVEAIQAGLEARLARCASDAG